MHLSETNIDQYQALCKSLCRKDIDRAKSRDELTKLVQITAIILKNNSSPDLKEVEESKNEN